MKLRGTARVRVAHGFDRTGRLLGRGDVVAVAEGDRLLFCEIVGSTQGDGYLLKLELVDGAYVGRLQRRPFDVLLMQRAA